MNAHLLDELPVFLLLTVTYFDIIVSEFARVQATYWRKSKLEWKSLTIEQPFGREHTWTSIESDYRTTIKRIQPRIDEIISKSRDSGCFILPNNPSIVSIDQGKLEVIYSMYLFNNVFFFQLHQRQNSKRIRSMTAYLVNRNQSFNVSLLSITNHQRNYRYKKVT